MRRGLHKSDHLGFLHQPALHFVLEHRRFARRAQAFAVHHAHAAQALLVGVADKARQGLARLVAALAVQINLALDAPFTLAQLLHHVHAHAGAAKAQLRVGIEQTGDVHLVAKRFGQRGLRI